MEIVSYKQNMDSPDKQDTRLNYQEFTRSITCLKATGTEVGLRINFGNPRLENKRFP
jgi:hypothetical protein